MKMTGGPDIFVRTARSINMFLYICNIPPILSQQDLPALSCKDLFECLRLIILPHGTYVVCFTTGSPFRGDLP